MLEIRWDAASRRVGASIADKLSAEWLGHSMLRRMIAARDRHLVRPVVESLVAVGYVEQELLPVGARYRLADRSSCVFCGHRLPFPGEHDVD